jgi:hypothetical protein
MKLLPYSTSYALGREQVYFLMILKESLGWRVRGLSPLLNSHPLDAPAIPQHPKLLKQLPKFKKMQASVLSPSTRLNPSSRLKVQKICLSAQQALAEIAILRYESRTLWQRVYQKDRHRAQPHYIISRARVVSEKDIMDARHARNNVRVLAIEWPGWPPPEAADARTTQNRIFQLELSQRIFLIILLLLIAWRMSWAKWMRILLMS